MRRWWPVWVVLTLAGLGVAYGPRVWRHVRLMRLQEACMAAEMPADRPVLESDPGTTRALVAAWPGNYQIDPNGWASYADGRWAALGVELGLRPWPTLVVPFPLPTLFCHERRTPGGRRRLVVVESWECATVIEPADWTGGRARVLWRDRVRWEPRSSAALHSADGVGLGCAFYGGVVDPHDSSRFTVPFRWGDLRGVWEYRLTDDERVTMRLLDPDEFTAQAAAAKAAARPAASRTRRDPEPPAGPAGR